VLAAKALAEEPRFKSPAEAKRQVNCAIESVAKRLGNTKAICRKSYIHPAILGAYLDGATIAKCRSRAATALAKGSLSSEEVAVVRMIESALKEARTGRPAKRAA
jgi:DNA topoisomerase-1